MNSDEYIWVIQPFCVLMVRFLSKSSVKRADISFPFQTSKFCNFQDTDRLQADSDSSSDSEKEQKASSSTQKRRPRRKVEIEYEHEHEDLSRSKVKTKT